MKIHLLYCEKYVVIVNFICRQVVDTIIKLLIKTLKSSKERFASAGYSPHILLVTIHNITGTI